MKYQIEVETHAHTVATTHAYSTVAELCNQAAAVGLKGLCITDHAPLLENGIPHPFHFVNLKILPRFIQNVCLIRGVELNISDYEGSVDLTDQQMACLDWVIASIHTPCLKPGTVEQITEAYLGALENPAVDCLGHIGQPQYSCDYETVVRKAGKLGKIIEINNNSAKVRKGSMENCVKVAKLCKQLGVRICVSTDTHYHTQLGKWESAFSILDEANFPPELIVNSHIDTFRNYILERRGIDIRES